MLEFFFLRRIRIFIFTVKLVNLLVLIAILSLEFLEFLYIFQLINKNLFKMKKLHMIHTIC